MDRAQGTVNALEREGELVFEAIYQPSYRHSAYRIHGPVNFIHFRDETSAIKALERVANDQGRAITIVAGKYPKGVRRIGDLLARTA